MRDHALIAAGRAWCESCQVWGLPTDAAWLTSTLVIASYAGCRHVTHTAVVDSASLEPDERCLATTRRGRRCQLRAGRGGRCPVHRAVMDDMTNASTERGCS